MARRSLLALMLLVLNGCTSWPTSPAPCAASATAIELLAAGEERSVCESSAGLRQRAAAVGSVNQQGTQTRTVGVPREFLVALIVLILLLGLA